MLFAVVCTMLPDKDGNRKMVMAHETFSTQEDAENYVRNCRRQNLPFTGTVVKLDFP